ncbi:hypothetical protein A4G19_03825 [Pasteurellaceae bacterium Macca]|nr:hypothetical protein [Pasteurellaceae bacterium Macca]
MGHTQFKQAPLPFVGQKRMFLTHFTQILNDNIPDEGEGWTIVDVFGGSGLLSHTAKRLKPKAQVIYNDFDGYSERLKHIKETNQLRRQLFQLVDGKVSKSKVIQGELKEEIIQAIKAFKGFKDVGALAGWLLFSGQQAGSLDELFKQRFYHGIRQTDYPNAEGYLDGIEIVSESFHTLLPKHQANSKALFVLDPPYLCTRQNSYKMANYFDLIDFLRLINLTRPPFLFFSSTKSEFVRFIAYLQEIKGDNWQAFENAQHIKMNATLNYQVTYEDNLVFKF